MSKTLPKDIDERARRSRNSIALAVTELGLRYPLEKITVRQLCEKAGISRSTFYGHFTSVEDYFTQSYAWLLERGTQLSASEQGGLEKVLPVRAILGHMAGKRDYVFATKNSRFRPAMMAAGEERLRLTAVANLERLCPELSKSDRLALATFVAGGFMAILRSWIATDMAERPEVIEGRFDALCGRLIASTPRA